MVPLRIGPALLLAVQICGCTVGPDVVFRSAGSAGEPPPADAGTMAGDGGAAEREGGEGGLPDAGGTGEDGGEPNPWCEIELPGPPCEITIPIPEDGGVFDPSTNPVPMVGGTDECPADTNAWYYDDPAAPAKVIACPFTCEQIMLVNDFFWILFGCSSGPQYADRDE
jgi:hypothetical protein